MLGRLVLGCVALFFSVGDADAALRCPATILPVNDYFRCGVRPDNGYHEFAVDDARGCQEVCEDDRRRCRAWSYVRLSRTCHLLNQASPAAVLDDACCFTGYVRPPSILRPPSWHPQTR
jgi:hypothetical protein